MRAATVSNAGLADLLGGVERAAARKDGQAGEGSLLVGAEELVAPCDRGAQRLLSFRSVARPSGEKRQPAVETAEQLPRRERLDACRRQLERER